LHYDRELAALRFADEQMHVFRHGYIPGDEAPVPLPDSLQFVLEDFSRLCRVEQWPALKTTEGDEMQTALILITFGLRIHWLKL
jgi:hypothetical protein